MSFYVDIILQLYPETREYLLTYLDVESLLKCCCVCKSWNILLNSSPMIWRKACQRYGILVKEQEKKKDTKYWKCYALKMIERKSQMRNGECISEKHYFVTSDVHAIYFYKGKIAIALDMVIQLWDCTTQIREKTFHCELTPLSIKIDENFVFSGSLSEINAWEIELGFPALSYGDVSELNCFDFLPKHSLVVGAYTNYVIFWDILTSIERGRIDVHNIGRLLLTLYPFESDEVDEDEISMLFTMTLNTISIGTVKYTFLDVADPMFSFHELHNIQLEHLNLGNEPNYFTFLFDGKFLYYPKLCRGASFICELLVKEQKIVSETRLGDYIQNILGVGKKYIAVRTLRRSATGGDIAIIDKLTEEVVAIWRIPWFLTDQGHSDNDALILCETSWLDGLNGANDEGAVYACVEEEIDENRVLHMVHWIPRDGEVSDNGMN